MLITDYKTLVELPQGTKIWVVETCHAEVSDVIFNFNLTANVNTFYPFNILERTHSDDVMFSRVDDGYKTGYVFDIQEMYQDLKDYDKFLTHKFIVTTSEREIISVWKDNILKFEETVSRLQDMCKRFKKDTFGSDLVSNHKQTFPEDWI